jgi:hypothetical protein
MCATPRPRSVRPRSSGIGEIGASALIAGVGEFKQFSNGEEFSAWLGIVPRQDSSGGKTRLGRITKRGDDYPRTLLIQGAKSTVMSAHKRYDPISRWLVQLTARVGWQKACVAMANKNARILWVVMTRDAGFDPKHRSVKPEAKRPANERAAAVPELAAACPAWAPRPPIHRTTRGKPRTNSKSWSIACRRCAMLSPASFVHPPALTPAREALPAKSQR